jgi:hypothetical protein
MSLKSHEVPRQFKNPYVFAPQFSGWFNEIELDGSRHQFGVRRDSTRLLLTRMQASRIAHISEVFRSARSSVLRPDTASCCRSRLRFEFLIENGKTLSSH